MLMNVLRAVTTVSMVESVTTLLVVMNAWTRVHKVSVKQQTAHALVIKHSGDHGFNYVL
jgi:hypothetical protein